MLNKVHLIGNLGADPETRTTGGGMVVASLRLATSRRVKKGDNWEEETEWHKVTVFGKTAENCAKYLKKGRQVFVEGRIHYSKYKDKDGNERYGVEVVADDVKFLGGKGGEGGGQSSSSSESSSRDEQPDPETPF